MQKYISIFMIVFSGGGLLFFGSQISRCYSQHEGLGVMVSLMAATFLTMLLVEMIWIRGIRRDQAAQR